jgi:hypothetical protein
MVKTEPFLAQMTEKTVRTAQKHLKKVLFCLEIQGDSAKRLK